MQTHSIVCNYLIVQALRFQTNWKESEELKQKRAKTEKGSNVFDIF